MVNHEGLLDLADKLETVSKNPNEKILNRLEAAANRASKAFSGSCLGYHSRVYYENFAPVPPGARFSSEWGFGDRVSNETCGAWREYDYDGVISQIDEWAGDPDSEKLSLDAQQAREQAEDAQAQLMSALSRYRGDFADDKFLEHLVHKIGDEKVFGYSVFAETLRPKGKFMSRDAIAVHAGVQTPPHMDVLAKIAAWRHPFKVCERLAKYGRRAGSHLASLEKKARRSTRLGTHVFIGHGRSPVWKDLRDFIRDRVKLPWDEFNRVSVAGLPNTTRLAQMLDEAAIALLVMTAEDEQADKTLHARMNVIHEAGLFQGRLGFTRAIILLEEGCSEFSNVQGLGQIRFPQGNISQTFEDIRQVLEREGLIDPPP